MRKPGDQPQRRADPPARQADDAGRVTASLVAQQTTVQFSGPLPDPQTLQEYEQALPGAAERIMALAERQTAHRMQAETYDAAHRSRLESQIVDAAIRSETWGRACAFTIALAFLGVSGWLINGGHDWAGGALGGIDIVGLVYVFVVGKKPRHRDEHKGAEP